MKIALGITLVLLVLTTKSTRPDNPWESTQSCNADGSTSSAERAASAALWSAPVASTGPTPTAATEETSHRLLHTERHTSPDYYNDNSCEATFGEDRLDPTSDYVGVESSAITQGRGRSLAPYTTTASWIEESIVTATVAPEPTKWISWLPSWCRHWHVYSTLSVPHDLLLRAFAEALEYHTVRFGNYWVQAQESADTDTHLSTKEPHTNFMSIMVQQVEDLQKFYSWIYQQLITAEDDDNNDFTPESLYHFLDALQRHATFMESVCNWSPSMRSVCNAPDSEILRNFFRVMDEQSIWMNILNRWAASQYNLTAGPQKNPHLWLPLNLNEDTPADVSNFPARNQKAGDSASGMEAVSNSVCTTEERDMVSNESFEDLTAEATAHSNYFSVTQLEQQKQNNQEGKLPEHDSQGMSKSGHESGQVIGTSGIPINNQETGMLHENGGDELGAASAHPQKGLNGYDRKDDVNPDEGSHDKNVQNVWQLEDWLRETVVVEGQAEKYKQGGRPQQIGSGESNLDGCSAIPVLQELGSGFIPHFLLYVKCNEENGACDPPKKCMPMRSEVTVEIKRWATLPKFPHTLLSVKEVPNDRHLLTLLVASYCVCAEAPDATN